MRRVLSFLLTLSAPALAARHAPVPAAIVRALSGSSAVPGARVEALDYQGPGRCTATHAEVERPIDSSGNVSLRIEGRGPAGEPCRGFARAEARLYAPVWVLRRALTAGEPIESALSREEREVRPGHLPLADLAKGLAATRALAAGTVLEASLVHDPSWMTGAPVRVVVRSGALSLTQQGRIIPCPQGRACAQLPSGRRVEGRRGGNELVLELP